MVQSTSILMPALRALMLLALAGLLAACAGRPRPVEPTRPFTVTEVRVTTQSMADFGFADRLQQRLDATAGRAATDVGLNSILRIVVLDRAAEPAGAGFFAPQMQSATLDLVLIDAGTGQMLRSRIVHGSVARGGQGADTALIETLVGEIRALLGLSGTPPYPVGGARRAAATPAARPEPTDDDGLADAAALSADPLLNGTVTPTTLDLDTGPQRPVVDLSRPLLMPDPVEFDEAGPDAPEARPEVEPEVTNAPVPEARPAPAANAAAAPAASAAASAASPPASADEPCIITLDNDCADPDGR